MRLQDNLEVELKLSVVGDDPDGLMAEVAGLDELGWLRGAGLVTTQERQTRRTVKYAFADGAGDEPLAELALDRTRFHLGQTEIPYWEIEVEQVSGSGEDAPRQIGQALLERYPRRL